MSYPDELLEHARALVERDAGQANLRRAVSSAYYALFHLIAAAGAQNAMPGAHDALRLRLLRSFDHREMKEACELFSNRAAGQPNTPLSGLIELPLEAPLRRVALAFVALQNARHAADYDLSAPVDSDDAISWIEKAQDAFRDWDQVKHMPNASAFLAVLMFGRRLTRSRAAAPVRDALA